MQRFSFKTLFSQLPIRTYIGLILGTTITYALLDFVPIYTLFPYAEARIVQALWQTGLWTLYAIFIAFWLSYGLGSSQNLFQGNFFDFFKTYFSEFLATKLRTLIYTSLWGLLFLIPGLIMALRYSLSEMVVFFNPHFLEDRTQDPLTISAQKIGYHVPTLLAIAGLYFLLPMVFDSLFERAHFLYSPWERLIQIGLYSILNLFTYVYLFKIFNIVKGE